MEGSESARLGIDGAWDPSLLRREASELLAVMFVSSLLVAQRAGTLSL